MQLQTVSDIWDAVLSSKNFPTNRNNIISEMLFPLIWLIFTIKAEGGNHDRIHGDGDRDGW